MTDRTPTDPTDAEGVLRRMGDARVLHEALVLVRALEHVAPPEAGAILLAVGMGTGHSPLCVARALLDLAAGAEEPGATTALTDAVRRRWVWPLHQHRHPDTTVGEHLWAQVRGHAEPSPRPLLN